MAAVVLVFVQGGGGVQGRAAVCEGVVQGGEDAAAALVGEDLPEVFFVPGDAARAEPVEYVLRAVAGKGGAREVRVVAVVGVGAGVEVGDVAAAAAGDADFGARFGVVVEQQHAQAAVGGMDGAVGAGGTGADDDGVVGHGVGL